MSQTSSKGKATEYVRKRDAKQRLKEERAQKSALPKSRHDSEKLWHDELELRTSLPPPALNVETLGFSKFIDLTPDANTR